MAATRNRLRIELFPPDGDRAAMDARVNASVLRLAGLIGRQMAREDFERRLSKDKRHLGDRPGDSGNR
jgi:hypothetical protein